MVLNLAVAGFAPAQTSPGQSQQTVSEAGVTLKQADVTLAQKQDMLKQMAVALAQKQYILNSPKNKLSGWASQYTGAGTVLVIPTAEMETQDLVAIMEDMNIMSRIFDRKIGLVVPSSVPMLGDMPLIGKIFHQSSRATEGIYLQGFGAMFFMGVNFPLSPPPKVQVDKSDEGADPVWEQTKRQILASGKDPEVDYVHERDAAAGRYDSEQVEELKTKLIKALKHAANIRILKKDESVTLVVAGNLPGLVVGEYCDEPPRYQYLFPGTAKKGTSRSSLMTIRAKKSDVDAFSKGELDLDAFRKKVVIFTYPYFSGKAKSGRSSSSSFMFSR